MARTATLRDEWHYADVVVEGLDDVSHERFLALVVVALTTLHGHVGGAVPLDVLRYDAAEARGVVRVGTEDAQKLMQACAALQHVAGTPARLRVLGDAPHLTLLGAA